MTHRPNPLPVYYDCDLCGAIHALTFIGECHVPGARFLPDDLDTWHGGLGWELIAWHDLPAARIRAVGEACFGATHGEAWLEPLAAALRLNPRTLQRAMSGSRMLPAGAWEDLWRLLARAQEVATAAPLIAPAA